MVTETSTILYYCICEKLRLQSSLWSPVVTRLPKETPGIPVTSDVATMPSADIFSCCVKRKSWTFCLLWATSWRWLGAKFLRDFFKSGRCFLSQLLFYTQNWSSLGLSSLFGTRISNHCVPGLHILEHGATAGCARPRSAGHKCLVQQTKVTFQWLSLKIGYPISKLYYSTPFSGNIRQ